MSTSVIPRPGDDLVPDGWWQRVVVPWADAQSDVESLALEVAKVSGLAEAWDVLGRDTTELIKARRYMEVRWGELLGEATMGRPAESSHASELLSKDDRLRFRQLASHRAEVVELLEQATDAEEITRAACIRLAKPQAPTRRDAEAAIGFEDDDEDEPATPSPSPAQPEAWTASEDRQRWRIDGLLTAAMQDLHDAASSSSYNRATRARLLREAEVKARRAYGQLGELAFSLERG